MLVNAVGVLDASFRGSIKARFRCIYNAEFPAYQKGDKIAQLIVMPYPIVELEEVDELSTTERGEGSFGSSGR